MTDSSWEAKSEESMPNNNVNEHLLNRLHDGANESSRYAINVGANPSDYNGIPIFSNRKDCFTPQSDISLPYNFSTPPACDNDGNNITGTLSSLKQLAPINAGDENQISNLAYTSNAIPQLIQEHYGDSTNAMNVPNQPDNTLLNSIFPQHCFDFVGDCRSSSFSKSSTISPDRECFTNLLASIIKLDSKSVIEISFELIPLMKKVTPQNYAEFLVGFLRKASHAIPLDEFYNLLYPAKSSVARSGANGIKINDFFHGLSGSKALKLCSFIVKAFESSHMSTNRSEPESMKNIFRTPVNCEEFKRTFFALKILFDSFKLVDRSLSSDKAISRKSVYKAYCEVSGRFTKYFSKPTKLVKKNAKHAMGIAQFGKLTKLVYPNLEIRRLGKRGYSKSYYLGIDWNMSIIDEDMSLRLGAEAPKNSHSSKSKNKPMIIPQKPEDPKLKQKEFVKNIFTSKTMRIDNSSYSFFDTSSKFPEANCQLRAWKHSTGKVPKQSSWARFTMLKSVKFLGEHKVDMWPVINNFQCNILSSKDPYMFSTDFIERMKILISVKSDEKGFMHLYLITLLLLFPVILSSDKEVELKDKVQLRKNMGLFINKILYERFDLPAVESNYLNNLLNIIRKMIHVNEMTSSQVKAGLAEKIIKEISLGLQRPTEFDFYNKTVLEDNIGKAVVMAFKAFRPASAHSQEYEEEYVKSIADVVEAFVNFVNLITETLLEFAMKMSSQYPEDLTFDFPYQLIKRSAPLFHQVCLCDPFIKVLPIRVINFIVAQVNKEVQNACLNGFLRQDHELAKETFKTWWIHSTLAEEYFTILAEIVALSEKLSDF